MANKRIKSFLMKSRAEYRRYKKTGDEDYLAQAGEKLWNVMSLLVQERAGKKITSYGDMQKEVARLYSTGATSTLLITFKNAYDLHKFFYRGWTDDIREIEGLYEETLNGLRLLGA
jgi:hypothetical protein